MRTRSPFPSRAILACLISALCATPTLAQETVIYDNSRVNDPSALQQSFAGGFNDMVAPSPAFLSTPGNRVTVDYTLSGSNNNPQHVYGGYSDASDNIAGNMVFLKNGTVAGDLTSAVVGGHSHGGNATGNTVNISGGIVEGFIYGGGSYAGNVTNNTVNISNGTVRGDGNVVGGNSSLDSVAGNTVNISGGAVENSVYGGISHSSTATGNTVILSGGSVTGGVTGGVGFGVASAAVATGNTVRISGNADISGVTTLHGGEAFLVGDFRTGNTLHISNWQGNGSSGNRSTGAEIANFERYHFTLPASAIGSGQAVLTTSGSVDLGSSANVSTRFTGVPAAALRVGQQAVLISAPNAITVGSSVSGTSFSQSTLGATDYTFAASLQDTDGNSTDDALVATLTGKQVNQDKAKSYLYGASARLTSLVNGADHMVSIMDKWKCASETPTTTGFCSFVSMQGSTIKTRTGSSINNNGASFALGGAFDTATRLGTLTTGVFAEGGIGRYNSYSRFGWGDGDTWHYGVGAFAKHAFTNRIYLEGSARIGRAKTDFDGKGSIADLHYNSEGNYWGAHAGVGIDYPLTQISSVDTYAKLLWTHQDSDTVTTRAKERLSFDSADSLRSRIGTRYRHTVEQNLRAHVGVGWEYEFDGKARAKLDGTKIAHEPETQGHSALVEAGIEWRATKSWSVNANATAMGGQRKGLTGYAQATYRF
ncbi:MAG: autotransporter outer membrane beta-barrel domain-containing protein [Burkholderiaceae bacterium]|jgi:hypothetical protein|nr:autotransporter outer membrane beta-barrel domain-containing protein [Burkholderiaceae bacterium]